MRYANRGSRGCVAQRPGGQVAVREPAQDLQGGRVALHDATHRAGRDRLAAERYAVFGRPGVLPVADMQPVAQLAHRHLVAQQCGVTGPVGGADHLPVRLGAAVVEQLVLRDVQAVFGVGLAEQGKLPVVREVLLRRLRADGGEQAHQQVAFLGDVGDLATQQADVGLLGRGRFSGSFPLCPVVRFVVAGEQRADVGVVGLVVGGERGADLAADLRGFSHRWSPSRCSRRRPGGG
jgi:hypothetical protein